MRLHAYVGDPNAAFNYSDDRLIDFANGNPGLEISIIFSSEPAFMQTWLENNNMISSEQIYRSDFQMGSANWTNTINLNDFTYFAYSHATNVSFCPAYQLLQNLVIDESATIYAGDLIELDNVVVNPPHELILIAPEVLVPIEFEIIQGAQLMTISEGCN